MSGKDAYISRFSAWAVGFANLSVDRPKDRCKTAGFANLSVDRPKDRCKTAGFGNAGDWEAWAKGKKQMNPGTEAPEISFTDSLLRRRLSQLSKMTIQVVHDLKPLNEDIKMIFLSFRGELTRQLRITRNQIEDKALMPAAFSLSVFNAAPALASLALGLKGGYSALYPAGNSFPAGLAVAKAALFSGTDTELVFVYADEEVPPEYSVLLTDKSPAFAFALLLSVKADPGYIPLSCLNEDRPEDFLKSLLLCKDRTF